MCLRFSSTLIALLLCACSSSGGTSPGAPEANDGGTDAPETGAPDAPSTGVQRIADRAVVKWLSADSADPWWVEENIAPQPQFVGEREVGRRSIVRAKPTRTVVFQPADSMWLTDACRHPSGEWSAVGFDSDNRAFLARGNASGLIEQRLLDDPELATDRNAWFSTPRTVPRVRTFTESGISVVADGEDVIVVLMTEDLAVIAYRYARKSGSFERGPRTLVSPAAPISPILPIGGSYDDFDAVVAPYLPRVAINNRGQLFVAIFADGTRISRHNTAFGTTLSNLRDKLYPSERTIDTLVARVDRDGRVAFVTVVGTPDNEDEVYGITASDTHVAVLGRVRRELGRDNTELHAVISELTVDGVALATTPFDPPNNAIALTGAYRGKDLWVGGAEGWTQNPSGRSLGLPGKPFLIRLHGDSARTIERLDAYLPSTGTHAELRTLQFGATTLFIGGLENGPITHTGDADRSLIRADGFVAIHSL